MAGIRGQIAPCAKSTKQIGDIGKINWIKNVVEHAKSIKYLQSLMDFEPDEKTH